MLKQIITIECIFICITFTHSKSVKIDNHLKQQHENSTKDYLPTAELPTFRNSTSLKMFEEITTKVWRTLPVINIPQSWVLAYCMKYTEISEDVEKATSQCQYDGTSWDCAFIEMGGGEDDFNVGKIVSLFHNLSNRDLRAKLLRGAEICGKLWQKYKQLQERRLVRMQVHVHVKNRVKRFTKIDAKLQSSKKYQNNLKKEKGAKIIEFEAEKFLSTTEETELDKLHLPVKVKPRKKLEEYSLAMDRVELSCLQEIGSCLSQQTAKACESLVLEVIQKLI